MTERRNGDGDRDRIDELAAHLDRRYRVVAILLMAMVIVGLAAVIAGGAIIRHNQIEIDSQQIQAAIERARLDKAQTDIQEGRRVAVSVICAATSAVIEAGRSTITGGATGGASTRFTRNLERLGYPPIAKRKASARRAADSYANLIASRIAQSTGIRSVVKANGSLDCKRLARLSRSP